jgi:hypothetical protein
MTEAQHDALVLKINAALLAIAVRQSRRKTLIRTPLYREPAVAELYRFIEELP